MLPAVTSCLMAVCPQGRQPSEDLVARRLGQGQEGGASVEGREGSGASCCCLGLQCWLQTDSLPGLMSTRHSSEQGGALHGALCMNVSNWEVP